MDGESSLFEGESAPPDYAKKAMPADRLAELALLDPKRAKRSEFFFSHYGFSRNGAGFFKKKIRKEVFQQLFFSYFPILFQFDN